MVEKVEENNNGNVISFMKCALGTGFIWPDQVDTDTVDQIIQKLSEPSLGRRDVLSFERSETQQYFP